jgi:hypothetical protein
MIEEAANLQRELHCDASNGHSFRKGDISLDSSSSRLQSW